MHMYAARARACSAAVNEKTPTKAEVLTQGGSIKMSCYFLISYNYIISLSIYLSSSFFKTCKISFTLNA